jgi:uncharacterized protein with ParB-like and HNH nuclease domain
MVLEKTLKISMKSLFNTYKNIVKIKNGINKPIMEAIHSLILNGFIINKVIIGKRIKTIKGE